MRRPACWGPLLLVLLPIIAAPGELAAAEVALAGHTFTLPDDFSLQLAAAAPLVERPIVADFDNDGRLYVAEASGTNDPVAKQLADRPHRVVRLVDDDGDGVFDRRTVFADRLMLPQGVMWLDGSLYVGAPPSIWKFTDTDGDGVADRREEWFDGKTLGGCANDIHGPFRGPDGWIYWCKGGFQEQTYERAGKAPFVTRAAHIFRARPDGTGIEPVMTGGMDNPVELVFTHTGERIFTTTFCQHPAGGQRDGLIHAIYGGVYGKVHDVLDGHVRTSPGVLPVLTQLGPAAPAGLALYEFDQFGKEYRDTLFAAQFNLHKVSWHSLVSSGPTFKTVDADFLIADDPDFHPTDVLVDADGSLLVIDTGGWYKLCCPTSQLVKPDLTGGIYRVRNPWAQLIDDPRGKSVDWQAQTPKELLWLMRSRQPAIVQRAADELVRLGNAGVEVIASLNKEQTAGLSVEHIWVLTRIDDPLARQLVAGQIGVRDESSRHVAMLSAGLWRDGAAVPALVKQLATDTPHNRRAAAEALGRIGDAAAAEHLLRALANAYDPILEHSLIYALIEIGDPAGVAAALADSNPRICRGALVALDQMPGEQLRPDQLSPFLASSDVELADTATWIASRHTQWGDPLADFYRAQLEADMVEGPQLVAIQRQLAGFCGSEKIQLLLAERLDDVTSSTAMQRLMLEVMASARLKTVPQCWIRPLVRALNSRHEAIVAEAVQAIGALPIAATQADKLPDRLLEIAHGDTHSIDLRLAALSAVPGGLETVDDATFSLLRSQLDSKLPAGQRARAAGLLAKAKLSSAQLESLMVALAEAGPLDIERLLAVFAQSRDEQIGTRLVEALRQSPALTTLRVEALKPVLENFGPAVKGPADELYAAIAASSQQDRAQVDALLKLSQGGDARRGQLVFQSSKAACAACHAIGYVGGKLGPDLTRIGQIRTERDLLEAIVFPSASFVRSYEPVQIVTSDGKSFSGLVRGETADEITLATSANDQVHIARADIEVLRQGTISIMPTGLHNQLTGQELADLLAFLAACR